MDLRVLKIVSACLAAGIAVGSISMHKCGSEKKIALQSPSLLGPDAEPFTGFESDALDIDDVGIVPMSYGNANFDIDKFTIVADTSYTDIASEYGKNPGDPVTYDGGIYWINRNTVLITAKDAETDTEQDDEVEVDDVIYLNLADKVTRVSYTSEWSLIKLENGTQGYLRSSYLSNEEVTPVPTDSPDPDPVDDDDDYDDDDDDGGSATSSYTPDPDPEPDYSSSSSSSDDDYEETPCDITVYASCALNTRSGPGISYSLLSTLSFGTAIDVVAETDNGWYKSSEGFYVKASLTLDSEPAPTPTPEPYYDDDDDDYDDYDYSDFASYVRSFIGCRYVYGGASPDGFDCSGFVMYCYETYYNIYLPHGATSQSYRGEEVDPDDIQVGDIICFDKEGDGIMEHAAIYVGNDTYVHAQSSATGVVESCYSAAKWKIGTVRRVL